MKSIQATIRNRRPLAIVVAITISALVLIGAYVFLSGRIWSEYQTSYQAWGDESQAKAEEALAPQLARSDKLSQLKILTASIDTKKDSRCDVIGFVSWQQFIDENKKKQEDCRKVASALGDFSQQVQHAIAYLEDDAELATILDDAIDSSGKLSQKQWSEQVGTWGSVTQAITAMNVTADFAKVKEVAGKKVAAVESAWKNVVAADRARDEAKYIDAEKDLIQAYAGLKDVSEDSADRFKRVATKVQATYHQAFTK